MSSTREPSPSEIHVPEKPLTRPRTTWVRAAPVAGQVGPVIALAAVAVMWSTVLALMDVLPRVTARLVDCLRGHADEPGLATG